MRQGCPLKTAPSYTALLAVDVLLGYRPFWRTRTSTLPLRVCHLDWGLLLLGWEVLGTNTTDCLGWGGGFRISWGEGGHHHWGVRAATLPLTVWLRRGLGLGGGEAHCPRCLSPERTGTLW